MIESSSLRASVHSIQDVLAVLAALSEDPEAQAALPEEERTALRALAGRLACPTPDQRRRFRRSLRKRRREEVRRADREIRDSSGIRKARALPVYEAPAREVASGARPVEKLRTPRRCYVCKAEFDELHYFYDQMCVPCGDFNYEKRFQSADLAGKTALVTGGRVKIGYQAALKVLRAGARVLVTTRFPRDAAARFSRESDFSGWRSRLAIFGLDLRHTPSVELFCKFLLDSERRLDLVINNACQTVRRPAGYFAHLLDREALAWEALPEAHQSLLALHHACALALGGSSRVSRPGARELALWQAGAAGPGITDSARLSQMRVTHDSDSCEDQFPEGRLDADLQQIDLATMNSWRMTLADVPTPELLEALLINTVAPFVLAARLKPLLVSTPDRDISHIVNVSAMEGVFSRGTKTDKHPHTNMAKAALNMLTRTSASDYARDGIYMNSVDTGWITDEDPAEHASRKRHDLDFQPPLDIVDGAARVCDPFFSGLQTGEHPWGKFFKDYRPAAW